MLATAHSPSPLAGEGARLSEPLGELSRSGRGGLPSREELLVRAKWMRANPTEAEQKLWQMLRTKRLAGYKFKRQVVIDWYIADFVNFEARVIVEADGSQHLENEYDVRRDAYLKGQGFEVLRFWNNDILRNMDNIQEAIWNALQNSPLPLRERVTQSAGRGGTEQSAASVRPQPQTQTQTSVEVVVAQTRATPLPPTALRRVPPSPARGEG